MELNLNPYSIFFVHFTAYRQILFRIFMSTFQPHIVYIIFLRAYIKVRWIHARTIITGMTDILIRPQITIQPNHQNAMRRIILPFIIRLSISIPIFARNPIQAFAKRFNIRPKSFFPRTISFINTYRHNTILLSILRSYNA